MKKIVMVGIMVWILAGAGCAPANTPQAVSIPTSSSPAASLTAETAIKVAPPEAQPPAAGVNPLPTEAPINGDGLFLSSSVQGTLKSSQDPAIVRKRFVNIRLDQLPQQGRVGQKKFPIGSTLELNLFDDVSFTAVLERLDTPSADVVSWVGHLQGVEGSSVIFTISRDGMVAGNISLPSASYQVRFAGADVYGIYQIDQAVFPPD